jgi:hypothetical protein
MLLQHSPYIMPCNILADPVALLPVREDCVVRSDRVVCPGSEAADEFNIIWENEGSYGRRCQDVRHTKKGQGLVGVVGSGEVSACLAFWVTEKQQVADIQDTEHRSCLRDAFNGETHAIMNTGVWPSEAESQQLTVLT